MCEPQNLCVQANWGHELAISDQATLLQVEFITDMIIGQQISSGLSLMWPLHPFELNHPGEDLVCSGSCLNFCEGEPFPCDAVQCNVPTDLRQDKPGTGEW